MVELFLTLNSDSIEVGAVDVDPAPGLEARLLIELLLKSNEDPAVTSTVVEVFVPTEYRFYSDTYVHNYIYIYIYIKLTIFIMTGRFLH